MSKAGVRCGVACSGIFALIALLGIALAIAFPLAIFPAAIRSQLPLQADSEGQLSQVTFYWSKPPITNTFSFYFFNITNQDEVTYYGAKPNVKQVGPYAFLESENKRNMSWDGNGESVWYQNYKTWIYNQPRSCPTCTYNDYVTLPNAAFMAVVSRMEQYNVSAAGKFILQMGLLLTGEYPIRTVPVRGVLFEGYEDPLISVLNSPLLKFIDDTFNDGQSILPFPVPALRKMGYFVDYNNSADENYWINTGKGDIDQYGKIKMWANMSKLPDTWWTGDYARAISGSDASLNPPFLKTSDKIYQFNSFLCRSLYLDYDSSTTVKSVPTYRFKAPAATFDTTLSENAGFRYENLEGVNYFPDWQGSPSSNSSTCGGDRPCVLPPGLFPLRCFPGKNQDTPFTAMYSAPHFLFSPREVINSVDGLNPIDDLHSPAVFDIEPTSGTTLEASFRIQVSFPMWKNPDVISLINWNSRMIPTFWLESHVILNDSLYDTTFFTFVALPKIILGLGIGLTLLAALIIVLSVFCIFRARRNSKGSSKKGGDRWQDYVKQDENTGVGANDNNPQPVVSTLYHDADLAGPSSAQNNHQNDKF